MARTRTPLGRAVTAGRDAHDPQRFRDRRAPIAPPLGPPPAWLTAPQADAWRELAAGLPWLNASHSCLLGIAAITKAQLVAGTAGVSRLNLLRQCLGQMGATPADAAKLANAR